MLVLVLVVLTVLLVLMVLIVLLVLLVLGSDPSSPQSLESKLASCREYVQEQTGHRRGLLGGSGAAAGQNPPSENHPTNGLYNKG